MKTISFFLLLTVIFCSCRQFYNIFPTPNDDPGWMHDVTRFKQPKDSLQTAVDKFIEVNTSIQRLFDNGVYDRGKYRDYRSLCNKDTLFFSIIFSGNDTISRIAANFFKLNNIPFNTLDYNTQRKAIKKNKAVYDSCQACYERIFLAPLKKYLQQ